MEFNPLIQALKFMVLGMGVVFVFLLIMIYLLKIQAKIVKNLNSHKKIPLKISEQTTQEEIQNTSTPNNTIHHNPNKKIAAIIAAIEHHTKA